MHYTTDDHGNEVACRVSTTGAPTMTDTERELAEWFARRPDPGQRLRDWINEGRAIFRGCDLIEETVTPRGQMSLDEQEDTP